MLAVDLDFELKKCLGHDFALITIHPLQSYSKFTLPQVTFLHLQN